MAEEYPILCWYQSYFSIVGFRYAIVARLNKVKLNTLNYFVSERSLTYDLPETKLNKKSLRDE